MESHTWVDEPDVEPDVQPDPSIDVSVTIHYPDASAIHSLVVLPVDSPLTTVAGAVMAAGRGACAAHSPVLAAILDDHMSASRRHSLVAAPPTMTVRDLDQAVEEHRFKTGMRMEVVYIDEFPEPVLVEVVRAILVMAGAW